MENSKRKKIIDIIISAVAAIIGCLLGACTRQLL